MAIERLKKVFQNEVEKSITDCCNNPRIIQRDGFQVCTNCGMNFSQVYDFSSVEKHVPGERWNIRNTEQVYSPIGPRTVIWGNKDAMGHCLSPMHNAKFERLAKINRGLINGYERNLWVALPIFSRLTESLQLPEYICDESLIIYKYAAKHKYTIGRKIEVLLAACIYATLRVYGIPKTIEEIIEVAQIEKEEFLHSYRLLNLEVLPKFSMKVQNILPRKYIQKFCDDLRVSMKVRKVALYIVEKAIERGYRISGRDPKGIAAGAIYISAKYCDEYLTQKSIYGVANITEVTLRTRYQELRKLVHLVKEFA